MTIGILGQEISVVEAYVEVYSVPIGKTATTIINLVNTGIENTYIKLALSESNTPLTKEHIEYDTMLSPSGILERTGIVLQAGRKVLVYASSSTVVTSVYGYEE